MNLMKLFFSFFLFFLSLSSFSQDQDSKWAIGAGIGVSNYTFNPIQTSASAFKKVFNEFPRINVSRHLYSRFILDAGFVTSFNSEIKYTTFDAALRYNLNNSSENIVPYFLVGAGYISSEKSTSTVNFGIGGTIWVTQKIGLNLQGIFRTKDDLYIVKSNAYVTAGIVYSFLNRSLVPRIWQ